MKEKPLFYFYCASAILGVLLMSIDMIWHHMIFLWGAVIFAALAAIGAFIERRNDDDKINN